MVWIAFLVLCELMAMSHKWTKCRATYRGEGTYIEPLGQTSEL
jgi:hypothetical protein